jgi:ATP-dependent HslUV protease, peptidase subunit HslV
MAAPAPLLRSTTVLLVRRGGRTCMASDGQVTFGEAVMKRGASKVKRTGRGRVLVGFAGGGADALALFTRFEAKLEEHQSNLERAVVELAKDWRTDRALRQLQAMMIVADAELAFLVSGNGDLLQPDSAGGEGSVLAIGSGGNYALAAARALLQHTELSAAEVARAALEVAAEICIYSNDRITLEELP